MSVQYFSKDNGSRLAYVYSPGDRGMPTVMFCGGYRSDMGGTKALYFEEQCRKRGQGYVRFDYSGHGESDGVFDEGTIGLWASDAVAILDEVAEGPVLLVGSSMGGWISLLVALARKERIVGMVGIAAAPDFTEDLYARLSKQQQELLHEHGFAEIPNDYSDEPYHFPLAFYEEAKAHLILQEGADLGFPVHLFQGMRDLDVLPETAERIRAVFSADAPSGAMADKGTVEITYIEDGDHRLSREQDLMAIDVKIREMS